MKKLILTYCILFSAQILPAQNLPAPDHVIIVMLENKGYSNILGNPLAPYLNSLAVDSNCAVFSESFGVTHPSQPNYVALFSGSTQGITNDNVPAGTPFSTCNLGYSLISNGYTFRGYSEELPSTGSLVFTSGKYVKRHCPWAFWQGLGTKQLAPETHHPFTDFPNNYDSLPTVSFIIPSLIHDMHDPVYSASTAISNGDDWLSTNIDGLVQWVKTNNSLLIIQYDEDEGVEIGGVVIGGNNNRIPTMFIGPMVTGGTYSTHINHYNVLRTLEDIYSLPYCDSSAFYQPIDDCWKLIAGIVDTKVNKPVSVYPVPASGHLNVYVSSEQEDNVVISITNILGSMLHNQTASIHPGPNSVTIDTEKFVSGTYFVSIRSPNINIRKKIVLENR